VSEPASIVDIPNSHMFERTVLRADRPVVVDFFADWCQPCHALAPIFEHLSRKLGEQVRFVRVDTEQVREVAQACGVRSLPTVALYWKGELRDVLVGMKSENQLEKRIRWLIDVSEGRGFLKRLFSRGNEG